ncbi:SBBP repeat-containing protein, partial [Klebsiella pneumoniae]|uniref:SBBP repeat-containing protein n=1 Tax=Klebsiella pneumoniae TaxID=573 RepID=UPI00259FED65
LNGSGTQALLNQKLGAEGAEGYGEAVAVDAAGKIYLTGTTNSWYNTFPVTPNAIQPLCGRKALLGEEKDCDDDAYVAVLSPAGEILYATYQ